MLVARGYMGLAVLLLLPLAAQLWSLRRSPGQGLELGWRAGRWYLSRAGKPKGVALARRAVLTPWVALLVVCEQDRGPQSHIPVFADSVPARDWRLLRVRLRQEEG